MAYDSVRAQLDKLLGPDRNGPLATTSTASTDYHHPEICKNYLLGFCPADLHIKHRSEPGSCKHRHSDSAKAVFQRDLASHRVTHDNARWTASLLSECRTIVADEDRKVRCHARRLKETYNVQGDLKGLMIKSFDTLKELGMVRKNARIRIMNETGGEELNADPVPTDVFRHAHASFSKNNTTTVEQTNEPLSADERQGIVLSTEGNETHANHQDHHCLHPKETGDCNAAPEEEDDNDDFGLIKVIPALNKNQMVLHVPKSFESSSSVRLSRPSISNHCDPNGSHKKSRDGSVRDASEQTRETNQDTHENHRSGLCSSIVEEVTNADVNRKGSPAKPKISSCASTKEPSNAHEIVASSKLGSSTDDEVSSILDVPRMPTGDSEVQEGELDRETNFHKMDFFYDRGVGPDGLLMLDKKQSLRVCACCGGYISLADAESRLLSHYGGKSHHSMALLRQKVQQLEAEVSAETRTSKLHSPIHARLHPQDSLHSQVHVSSEERPSCFKYAKSPERYKNRYGSRINDRFDDRHRARYRRDNRGFGTSDWYNNYRSENGEDYPSRWSDARRSPMANSNQQHQDRWNGRKRHRSRSPIRDLRRTRRR